VSYNYNLPYLDDDEYEEPAPRRTANWLLLLLGSAPLALLVLGIGFGFLGWKPHGYAHFAFIPQALTVAILAMAREGKRLADEVAQGRYPADKITCLDLFFPVKNTSPDQRVFR
jgi:hypothetical protein